MFRVLLSLLTLQGALSQMTSLSINQCPSAFNVTTANYSSSAGMDSLKTFFYSNLYSSSEKATIQSNIVKGDTAALASILFSPRSLAPFIAIAVCFLLTFLIVLCCCVFQKSCPPCQSWKRDFTRRPYEKNQLRCAAIFTMIFGVGAFATAIVAFSTFPTMQSDLQNSKCALYLSLDIAINGDQPNHWGGFTQLTSQVAAISQQLASASNSVSNRLGNSNWLNTDMNALLQSNINLYVNNVASTVYSPDPTTTTTAVTGSLPLPTRIPLFIAKGLGPNATTNTMVNSIDAALRVTKKLSDQGYAAYTSAQLLATSATTITANTNAASQDFTAYSNDLAGVQISLNAFSTAVFDSIFSWGIYLIEAVVGVILAGSLLLLIGVIATHSFEIFNCKTTLHVGWVLYGLSYFGIIALSLMFFSMGGLSYVFCQFYQSTISVQSDFSTLGTSTGSNSFNKVFSKLDSCFFGNGDVLSKFDISAEMGTVTTLFANIQTYNDYLDPTNAKYVNVTQAVTTVQGWIGAMTQYNAGIYIDSDPNETTDDNPTVSLRNLNTFTNNGTGGVPPTCTFDYWVFDEANCSNSPSQTKYSSGTPSNGLYLPQSGSLCISFNQRISSTSSIWTHSDFINRYKQIKNACPVAYQNIISYAQALINYRDSRINLYSSLIIQLNSLRTGINAFNTRISTFTAALTAFTTDVGPLKNLTTNQLTGLQVSSDCRTIANQLRFFNNAFCINFMSKSVVIGICCIVLLALMLAGMLVGSVLAVRYARVEKNLPKIHPQLTHDMSETFQKRKDTSESSDSEDD